MKFTATEAGFKEGLGGASNAESRGKAHYVLFGLQKDDQHPTNAGVYFEWDDEANGAVDCVVAVSTTPKKVTFTLTEGRTIVVSCGIATEPWAGFLAAIEQVFPPHVRVAAVAASVPGAPGARPSRSPSPRRKA